MKMTPYRWLMLIFCIVGYFISVYNYMVISAHYDYIRENAITDERELDCYNKAAIPVCRENLIFLD